MLVRTAGWWNGWTRRFATRLSKSARRRPCSWCARAWLAVRWSESSLIARQMDRKWSPCRSWENWPHFRQDHSSFARRSRCRWCYSSASTSDHDATTCGSRRSPIESRHNAQPVPKILLAGSNVMSDDSRRSVGRIRSIGSIFMISGVSLCRRRLGRLLLPTLLFPLSSTMADPLPRPSQDAPERLMQMLASVQESRAAFTEVKVMANLTRPLQDSGRLSYRRPSHLEKVTIEPLAESLVVDGDRLTLTEGGEAPQVVDLNAEPMIRGLVDAIRGTLSGDLAMLRRAYRVSMQGDLAAWRLTLIPTDPRVARLIASTTIEGAGTSLRVVQTTQTNGDDMRMTITPIS